MSNDHNIMRLPDAPPPAPDARDAAMQQALLRFDQKIAAEKNADASQGMPTDIRLIERTAAPLRPSRERIVMKRTRFLMAASLACIVVGSGAYLHLMRSPQLQDAQLQIRAGVERQKDAAAPVEQKVASNFVAPIPATQEKKESDNQPKTQIQTAPPAAKPNQEAAAPSIVAPPAKPRMEGQIAGLPPPPASAGVMAKQPPADARGRFASREPSPMRAAPLPSFGMQTVTAEIARERVPGPSEPVGRDQFANAPENAFKAARDVPVSTFSIDVDTASYSFVRAQLNRNVLPQPASVRTEELINYCLLYTSPSPRDGLLSRMPSSA